MRGPDMKKARNSDSGPEVAESEDAASAVPAGQNPIDAVPMHRIAADVRDFVTKEGLQDYYEEIHAGGLAAKIENKPGSANEIDISDAAREALLFEETHAWRSTPKKLYLLCALCAACAIVQGMDQTVINGAQEFYFREFGIEDNLMKGFLNGSPYCAAALVGCWLNQPLNKYTGRRGTIFISCAIAFITGIWQAVSPNWQCFLAARLFLGIAVGAKSSTAPIYAAECAPKRIRGALTMMWQMWTAFGIMLGYATSIAFQEVDFLGENSQWRWMIGITSFPPLLVMAATFLLPESPRWYMDRGREGDYVRAYESMRKLRSHDVLAARDMYVAYKFLEVEREKVAAKGRRRNALVELLTVGRNLRAAQSAWFCMFMQQFCGVNVIAYYSTMIFASAKFSRKDALLASFGCGALNWLGALPAVFTIDRFGRRKLLLVTLPFLSICLFWAGSNFNVADQELRNNLLMASIYIFMFAYSPGLGPVPFTYAAEAFPLHIRAQGMASATSITWALNFVISFSWSQMMNTFTVRGGFYFYATWNIIGFIFAYFLVPETKNRTLEELDVVFSVRNRDHAAHQVMKLKRGIKKLTGKQVDPVPELYKLRAPTLSDSAELVQGVVEPKGNDAV